MKALTASSALALLLLAGGAFGWKWSACHLYGWDLDRNVRYSLFTGCLVNMPTGWTPRTELRTEQ